MAKQQLKVTDLRIGDKVWDKVNKCNAVITDISWRIGDNITDAFVGISFDGEGSSRLAKLEEVERCNKDFIGNLKVMNRNRLSTSIEWMLWVMVAFCLVMVGFCFGCKDYIMVLSFAINLLCVIVLLIDREEVINIIKA